jgi:hypothetical protein
MNRALLALIVAAISAGASAQQSLRLQCDGTGGEGPEGKRKEFVLKGGVLEIRPGTVRISGIPGFDREYQIDKENDKLVSFQAGKATWYGGTLNKYPDRYTLLLFAVTNRNVDRNVAADCVPAK